MRDESILIRSDDMALSVRVAGERPLVILMHGWPELGRSRRHQVIPLAEAGFTVAVPDMRGYGGSFKPHDVPAYNLDALADDWPPSHGHCRPPVGRPLDTIGVPQPPGDGVCVFRRKSARYLL